MKDLRLKDVKWLTQDHSYQVIEELKRRRAKDFNPF